MNVQYQSNMKFLPIFAAMIIFMNLIQCKAQDYTPDTSQEERLHFGSGGGFAGTITEYCLLQNGEIFVKQSHDGEWVKHHKVKDKVAKQCFSQIEHLNLKDVNFNIPGNVYRFLKVADQNHEHKIVWGGAQKRPTEDIVTFYAILQNMVKDINVVRPPNPVR